MQHHQIIIRFPEMADIASLLDPPHWLPPLYPGQGFDGLTRGHQNAPFDPECVSSPGEHTLSNPLTIAARSTIVAHSTNNSIPTVTATKTQ